ncbi:hypothetical protein, partial [Duncaniella muris]|uniref:hypothetical protein n=1 Tax=Duncaniella muris TaxID=2094150 RepID=UPI00272F8897
MIFNNYDCQLKRICCKITKKATYNRDSAPTKSSGPTNAGALEQISTLEQIRVFPKQSNCRRRDIKKAGRKL